jgi:hypothetical protein
MDASSSEKKKRSMMRRPKRQPTNQPTNQPPLTAFLSRIVLHRFGQGSAGRCFPCNKHTALQLRLFKILTLVMDAMSVVVEVSKI